MLELTRLIDDPDRPLSEQLATAVRQLTAMDVAGEFDPLPTDTRCLVAALNLFLAGAAGRARDMEYLLSDSFPPRAGRMEPISAAIGRIVAQVSAARAPRRS